MTSVFVSYSSKDKEAAEYISAKLQKVGIDVFIDYERLTAGESFPDQLGDEIRNRDVLLFLVSPHSIDSTWVQAEVNWARSSDRRIIPVTLEEVDMSRFWFLSHIQRVDFTSWPRGTDAQTNEALIELITALTGEELIFARRPWDMLKKQKHGDKWIDQLVEKIKQFCFVADWTKGAQPEDWRRVELDLLEMLRWYSEVKEPVDKLVDQILTMKNGLEGFFLRHDIPMRVTTTSVLGFATPAALKEFEDSLNEVLSFAQSDTLSVFTGIEGLVPGMHAMRLGYDLQAGLFEVPSNLIGSLEADDTTISALMQFADETDGVTGAEDPALLLRAWEAAWKEFILEFRDTKLQGNALFQTYAEKEIELGMHKKLRKLMRFLLMSLAIHWINELGAGLSAKPLYVLDE